MKKLQTTLMILFTLLTVNLFADGNARLQVIHNSADPAAETVDIYVNGALFQDDFMFRTATPFVDVPSGVELNIGVAPGNSTGPGDIIATIPVTLAEGQTYAAIANGVLDPSQFAGNPDGKVTAFNLFLKKNVRESAYFNRFVEFLVFHGATDAPEIDVHVQNIFRSRLVNDLMYGEFSWYKRVFPGSFVVDITPADDKNTVVASFEIDLSGLGGGAAIVFASGFLTPGANQDGEAFGLFAALPDGTVVEFPQVVPTAELQVIHNSSDPAANVVDIYVNGSLFQDDFAFRTATPFVEVSAGVELAIGVAGGNSSGPEDIIATIPVTLDADETYVAIANGVLDPNSFAENPDGRSIAFDLYAKDGIRTDARWFHRTDFLVFHGATDAPAVDVIARDSYYGKIIDDASYGDFTNYLSVRPNEYILDVTPGNDNSTVVASFVADLSGLGGGSAVVFASCFLTPGANQDGQAFRLFPALADGTVVEFPAVDPETPEARLQVIHNSADPAVEVVDIYVNDDLFLNDFAFRDATPFVDVPAEVELGIGIAGSDSEGPEDIIATIPVTLENNQTYVAFANGVLDPGMFAENPDGRSIAFDLYAIDNVREEARWGFLVDLLVFHGSSDAPGVDVIARGWWSFRLINDLFYGDFADYRSVFAQKYQLDVTPSFDNSTVVASFEADLSGLKGGSAVVFASGFLNPSANQDGATFGLFAALPDGTVIELPAVSGGYALTNPTMKLNSNVPQSFELGQNYPNPFNPTTIISFSLPEPGNVSLKVYNVLGQEVETLVSGYRDAGIHTVDFDASRMASGVYFYRITTDNFSESRKMMLLK